MQHGKWFDTCWVITPCSPGILPVSPMVYHHFPPWKLQVWVAPHSGHVELVHLITVLTWHLQQIPAANSIKKRDFCRNLLPIPARMIDGSVKPKPVIQIGFSRDGTFPSVRGTLFLFMYKSHIYIYAHKDHHPHTHSHIYRICHTRIYIYIHIITHIYISLSLCFLLQYTNPMYKLYDVGAYHVCLGPKIPPPCQRATVWHHSSIESYGESQKYRPWL